MLLKKFIFLFVTILLFTSFSMDINKNVQSEKLEILVNGRIFNPEAYSVPTDGKITFRIKNRDYRAQYKFDDIRFELIVRKKTIRNNKEEYRALCPSCYLTQYDRRVHDKEKNIKYHKIGEVVVIQNGFDQYSYDGAVTVPYDQFKYIDCLSRTIFHVWSVKKKIGSYETYLDVSQLGIPYRLQDDGISFYPHWVPCRN